MVEYTCKKCLKIFKKKYNYDIHKNKKIPCDKYYNCEFCNYKNKNKKLLQKHLDKQNCYSTDKIIELIENKRKIQKENLSLEEQIKELKKEMEELKTNKNIITNNIIPIQITNSINIQNEIILNDENENEKNKGILYLIQPAELIDTKRFKIGRSNKTSLDRVRSYRKGTRYLCIFECDDPVNTEKVLIEKFNERFKLIAGNEYFEGDEKEVRDVFIKTFNEINYIYKSSMDTPSGDVEEVKNNKCGHSVDKII